MERGRGEVEDNKGGFDQSGKVIEGKSEARLKGNFEKKKKQIITIYI